MSALLHLLRAADTRERALKLESLAWHIWIAHNDPAVSAHMRAGVRAMRRGAEGARESFLTAAAIDTTYAEALNKLAALEHKAGDYDASKYFAQEALLRFPGHFGALAGLSLAYERSSSKQEAVSCLRQALTVYPWASHLPTIYLSMTQPPSVTQPAITLPEEEDLNIDYLDN
jgi:tetratricopeptide (TPR) repeat protein